MAMAFDEEWWLGFGSGFVLFSAICLVAIILVRHLLSSSIPIASTEGVSPKLGRWRIALVIFLLALKTFGVGACVYWILVVLRLPLPAFAAGLFGGLTFLILGSIVGSRFGAEKKKKKH